MANEVRLIDANEVAEEISEAISNIAFTSPYQSDINTMISGMERVLDIVEDAPTVDAVPVVHGYWIDSTSVDHIGRIIEHSIDCSVCDSVFKDDSREVVKYWKKHFKVCPFCGSLMDGDEDL